MKLFKYILITNDFEINIDMYVGFKIYCCTICPTFGSIVGKNIIKSFDCFRIISMVKLLDYFFNDVGKEVILLKNTPEYDYFFTFNIFLTTSIPVILRWLAGKKFFLLKHAPQNCGNQIDDERVFTFIYCISQTNCFFASFKTTLDTS